jgi:hypothetical protein
METHTSSFAFIFLCFFDFRLSTFSHGPSAVSPSVGISSESETRGDVFSLFEGTDEGEECRFMMVVAFWEMKRLSAGTCSAHSSSSIQPYGDNHLLPPWVAEVLTHTRTIQSTTSPLAQSG